MTTVAAISQQIWDMKYRLKLLDGQPVDKTIGDTWTRVAKALAEPELNPAEWTGRFAEALSDFQFLPAGRILAGAGTGRTVTLFNCFVMGTIPDDMGGIFANLREAALTMQQGGGIGYDFSTLRPKGAPVLGVGADASGPLSFMDVWDAMCRTIMSAGHRRGAMMATLRCDHPDIEAFIEAKREAGRLRMFNLSVLVTDAFMTAVRQDDAWPLVFGVVAVTEARPVPAFDPVEAKRRAAEGKPLLLLDRIGNPHNLGAIVRTAAFFGLDRIVISDHPSQAGPSEASYRVAEGGMEHVRLYRANGFPKVLQQLRTSYRVLGTALGRGEPLERLSDSRPVAIVLGNEEDGLDAATIKACEGIVTLAGAGHVQSLNVAATAAILIHELTRRAPRR